MTPPTTAGLDTLAADSKQTGPPNSEVGSSWVPTPAPSLAAHLRQLSSAGLQSRRRALSDSTVQGAPSSVVRELDDGAFKVVISKPVEETRPKTMEDAEPEIAPVLNINIPSWKMGSPRFTGRGSPMLRGSSFAPTDEPRLSPVSFLNKPHPEPSLAVPSGLSSSHLSAPSMQVSFSQPNMSPLPLPSPQLLLPVRSTYLSTHLVIEPTMFDDLTFKPACDDRSIVRYSANGTVTAATPPRLVAEITSPSFLDYELISDFFLTFRGFLEPSDLVRMLFARLRWAIERGDETGMVVRVRTFVALRHWILNYFEDDFFVDYALRVTFCELINELMDDLYRAEQNGKAHLKILSELKKCWRRACALYWDGPEFDPALGGEVPVTPGGASGLRDPGVDPSQWDIPDIELSRWETRVSDGSERELGIGNACDALAARDRPGTPDKQHGAVGEFDRNQQASPTSFMSLDVVSCSFPAKSMRNLQFGQAAAHPVPVNPAHTNTGMVAITPKAVMGKMARPIHKRNGSVTDSLRDHSIDKGNVRDVGDPNLAVPYGGSLVRGDLLPPGHAFVDVLPPRNGLGDAQRETTFLHTPPDQLQNMRSSPSAMSGQGMRRLVGSVRRALSTRGQGIPATQGNFIDISPIGPRGATTNRLPGTAIVPQARPYRSGTRPPVRIDLLGAEIAEDFKKAVREGAAAEAAAEEAIQRALLHRDSTGQPLSGVEGTKYSAAHLDSSFENLPKPPWLNTASEAEYTTGSKSIVIVDDTAFKMPSMRGTIPTVNPSHEAFADSFDANGGGPTPPITPPGRFKGTPRQSSHLLNRHLTRESIASDSLPPFVLDMSTLGGGGRNSSNRQSYFASRPSMDQSIRSGAYPPSAISRHLRSTRLNGRQRSSRIAPSLSSALHRRAVSFSSSHRPPTLRSFDATTVSDMSHLDKPETTPSPPRVLRRKPGGNLGAAKTVGDLKIPLRNSRSVGSLTTYSESLHSSFMQHRESSGFVDIVSSDFSHENVEAFSLGAMAEKSNKRHMSLFSTHSSRPVMRPSFEAEARKLAEIPDDTEDEGGVEAALLKLEGRYEKKGAKASPAMPESPLPDLDAVGVGAHGPVPNGERGHRNGAGDDGFPHYRYSNVPGPSSDLHGSYLQAPTTETHSFLSTEQSYCSIPLLERGLSDDEPRRSTQGWTNISILRGSDEDTPAVTERGDDSHDNSRLPSFDIVEKTDSVRRAGGDGIVQRGEESEEQSYLDDDSDNYGGSDLSSEMSAEPPENDIYGLGMPSQASPREGFITKSHDQGTGNENEAMSRTKKLGEALRVSPEAANIPQLQEHQVYVQKPLPPTPDTTPTSAHRPGSSRDPNGAAEAPVGAAAPDSELNRKYSAHLPFILAFDSEVLAQQFTLIEKDALNEIDWKELIDMEWKNATNKDSRSWVDFLRHSDARGVEVVVARFNIMVKWAISEIVLTRDVEERARCVIKLVHIAAHCRRHRNFATMAQIAVALSSQEVARLSRTWALVPPSDLESFQALEQLVSPTRNFYSLRAEMEGGGTGGVGCIPFVGIYTHDLLFNAQRASEIASSPTTAPLVNFERCRCAAAVVKTLLRLLEESAAYGFVPVEGITERCLWMSALSDEQIRKCSAGLE